MIWSGSAAHSKSWPIYRAHKLYGSWFFFRKKADSVWELQKLVWSVIKTNSAVLSGNTIASVVYSMTSSPNKNPLNCACKTNVQEFMIIVVFSASYSAHIQSIRSVNLAPMSNLNGYQFPVSLFQHKGALYALSQPNPKFEAAKKIARSPNLPQFTCSGIFRARKSQMHPNPTRGSRKLQSGPTPTWFMESGQWCNPICVWEQCGGLLGERLMHFENQVEHPHMLKLTLQASAWLYLDLNQMWLPLCRMKIKASFFYYSLLNNFRRFRGDYYFLLFHERFSLRQDVGPQKFYMWPTGRKLGRNLEINLIFWWTKLVHIFAFSQLNGKCWFSDRF